MTSKYQKTPFPVDSMAKMQNLSVKTRDGQIVDIDYQDLKLDIINNQLCFIHESGDGNLVMPIARLSTISKIKG